MSDLHFHGMMMALMLLVGNTAPNAVVRTIGYAFAAGGLLCALLVRFGA